MSHKEERVKLSVLGISYNPLQSGAFGMLLAEENGPYRIPIMIGAAEAQSIAIKLEGVNTPRPMTHDLFSSFAQAFGIRLVEVFIYKFEDGVFSSELKFTDGQREVSIDSRTSDAVAIAVRCDAPIYTTREIVDIAGTIFDESTEQQLRDAKKEHDKRDEAQAPDSAPTLESLQKRLEKLIEEENYEEAAKISAQIKSLKDKGEA